MLAAGAGKLAKPDLWVVLYKAPACLLIGLALEQPSVLAVGKCMSGVREREIAEGGRGVPARLAGQQRRRPGLRSASQSTGRR